LEARPESLQRAEPHLRGGAARDGGPGGAAPRAPRRLPRPPGRGLPEGLPPAEPPGPHRRPPRLQLGEPLRGRAGRRSDRRLLRLDARAAGVDRGPRSGVEEEAGDPAPDARAVGAEALRGAPPETGLAEVREAPAAPGGARYNALGME